jgi:hypothetical protein
MIKLFRLPVVLLKLAVFAVVVAYGLMMFPAWTEGFNVSTVVHAVLRGIEWMVEQVEKLH